MNLLVFFSAGVAVGRREGQERRLSVSHSLELFDHLEELNHGDSLSTLRMRVGRKEGKSTCRILFSSLFLLSSQPPLPPSPVWRASESPAAPHSSTPGFEKRVYVPILGRPRICASERSGADTLSPFKRWPATSPLLWLL